LEENARVEQLKIHFKEYFGVEAEFVARAPGRVNLIGEHTDYNGGFVLPAAIDRSVLIAAKSVLGSRMVELVSLEFGNRTSFDLDNIKATPEKALSWSNYVMAVVWALGQKDLIDLQKLSGVQLVIQGDVPRGSGLSSSAAIEVASALAFLRLAGTSSNGSTIALTCQKAENEFIGVKSGIMDQFISALGQPDSALLIDTRSLEYKVVPLGLEELGYRVVAVDSAVPRSLGNTAYNQRRAECEESVKLLAPKLGLPDGSQLRDITPEQLAAHSADLPDILRKRARHVISEDARTLEAVGLMQAGFSNADNLARFGKLLYASHTSLRDDYEVSCKELDLLVELASSCAGVVGARMTGGGFGGCTVNIVQAQHLADFERQVVQEYRQRTGLEAKMHVCKAVAGGSYLG